MEPWPCNDEVGAIGIVFGGMAENLPGAPGIFLIPKAGDVEIGNGRGVKLADPGFFFPEFIVVGMRG